MVAATMITKFMLLVRIDSQPPTIEKIHTLPALVEDPLFLSSPLRVSELYYGRMWRLMYDDISTATHKCNPIGCL